MVAVEPTRWLMLRLTEDELHEVRAWASRHSYRTDEAARRLVQIGLSHDGRADEPGNGVGSAVVRWIGGRG